ncbi:hypothetical protein ILYODFUR_020748 [Ilyodon furcidens]|uniref:Uncharacterized protein n=1 Tax=Ilyodon furcidens TaxID=33524 RepID=A0ABV0UHV2_9TELE
MSWTRTRSRLKHRSVFSQLSAFSSLWEPSTSRSTLTAFPNLLPLPPCLSTLQPRTPTPGKKNKKEPSTQHNHPSCQPQPPWRYSPSLDKPSSPSEAPSVNSITLFAPAFPICLIILLSSPTHKNQTPRPHLSAYLCFNKPV